MKTLMAYKSIVLEKIPIVATRMIERQELAALKTAKADVFISELAQTLCVKLKTQIHGITNNFIDISEEWPKTWWDAFKERWFTKRMLKRWPVEYKRIYVHQPIFLAVCPHLQNESDEVHLRWLISKDEEANNGKTS